MCVLARVPKCAHACGSSIYIRIPHTRASVVEIAGKTTCSVSIPYGCQLELQLLHFQSISLLPWLGKQERMAQGFGSWRMLLAPGFSMVQPSHLESEPTYARSLYNSDFQIINKPKKKEEEPYIPFHVMRSPL